MSRCGVHAHPGRVAPGEKDLSKATPISLQNVHDGDRHPGSRGNASAGGIVQATSIILMQQLDMRQNTGTSARIGRSAA